MTRPRNEDPSLPTRGEISARLATKRNRRVVVEYLNELAQHANDRGRGDVAGDILALGDLYAAAEHPFFDGGPRDSARWRRLNGAEMFFPTGEGG